MTLSGSTPAIQISVPVGSSLPPGGGLRSPYWRVDEKVTHSSLLPFSAVRWKTNGLHFGNELVRSWLAPSVMPGALARASSTEVPPAVLMAHRRALGSVSALHSLPPLVQVDSSYTRKLPSGENAG